MALSAKAQREYTSQLEVLLFKRDMCYQQVDSLYSLSLSLTVDSGNLDEFRTKMDKLESNYASFNKCNLEIIKLRSLLGDEKKADELVATKKLCGDMDTRYFHLVNTARHLCPNRNRQFDESLTRPNLETTVKLPTIDLPHFDGTTKDWPAFKDCFVSMIHDNHSLSDIHKFQYLLSATKGEANALVRTLPLTEPNYGIIWNKLLARFDNKRILSALYVDEILNFENLTYESPSKLRQLLDTLVENTSAIERIHFPDNLGNFILFHAVTKKLDKRTRQLFEEEHSQTEFPTLENLKTFLLNHCKAIEAAQGNDVKHKVVGNKPNPKPSYNKGHGSSPPVRLSQGQVMHNSFVSNTVPISCIYCSETHSVYKCSSFNALTPQQRKEFVRSKRFCFNCLSNLHMMDKCNSNNTCKICNRRHHTLIHIDSSLSKERELPHSSYKSKAVQNANSLNEAPDPDSKLSPQLNGVGLTVNTGFPNKPFEKQSVTLLGTVKMQMQDNTGHFRLVRALVDPGSQLSFITESCVKNLGLSRQKYSLPIMGLSQTPINATRGIVNCLLKSSYDNQPTIPATAVVLDRITSPLPTCTIGPEVKQAFQHLNLADNEFGTPGPIDFLIGADLYPYVFDGGRLNSPAGYPTPYHSVFGWVLIGQTTVNLVSTEIRPNSNLSLTSHLCVSDNRSLDAQLKQFWELEEFPKLSHVSEAEKFCEDHFVKTHARDPDTGRYIVKLPFKEKTPELGASYQTAISRLRSLENRLVAQPELRTSYNAFMEEYEHLGHMRLHQECDPPPKHFIPHHGIFKESSSSTKFRTVFDASAVTSNGKSLNDLLHSGPKLQKDIVEIICHFRLHAIAVAADISKMYRQILVHSEHQPYQTIVWRNSTGEPIQLFTLTTVTYGVTSSPFLAMRTLHQLVQDEGKHHSLGTRPILEDMFVDDLLTGAPSVKDALLLKHEITSLLSKGGFELKKWSSNSSEFLSSVMKEDREPNLTFNEQDNAPVIKVLGIQWCPFLDVFSYQVQTTDSVPTKRNILSHIARIFDILGWVTPVVIFAKILIQRLWILGIGWDDLPDKTIQEEWFQFINELPILSEVRIPRYVLSTALQELTLHGFCDASTQAYAAVVYTRIENQDKAISSHIFLAKSRVAPLKTISLPKLELCAAVLLAKLLDYSNSVLCKRLNVRPVIYAWSDSTIALNWIHSSPHVLKTFVANRVAFIQDKTNPNDWYHVSTSTNPADCASRGLFPSQLINHKSWWQGPQWLMMDQSFWPKQDYTQVPLTHLPEVRPVSLQSNVSKIEQDSLSLLERFSKFERLRRITAWCFRFSTNCSKQLEDRILSPLSVKELSLALNHLIQITQSYYFSDAIKILKANLPLTGALAKLDVFLDSAEILRVGGRLGLSDLSYDKKHPILLPKQAHLSTLIVDHYHHIYFHSGPRTLQSILLRRFWILSSRNLIRKRLRLCIQCAKFRALTPQPFMAPLPAARLQRSRPFLRVGIDFGGPFLTKTHHARKPLIYKSYLCLFVCLCTKAVHLETVSGLSTEQFLAALNRFVARRGICSDIYSDNGTNFIGAYNQIKEVYLFLKENAKDIQSSLSLKEIQWHFNPPSAPHFGGLWEAGIKATKYHLRRIIGEQVLTFEELGTLFCQIEAVLNSRPLCTLSTDPNEFEVLTPGHFLIGDSLLAPPQQDLTSLPLNRLSRWQLVQQATQHFWHRWSNEYLHTLQQRTKWTTKSPNLAIGDLVLLKESNIPPLRWPMGIVTEIIQGSDGTVRVVSLRLKNGQQLRRPVVKLCPLPIER